MVQAEPLPTTGAARGRPAACWALTAEAVALFPDRHAELTVELIDADPRSSSTPTPGARAAAQPPRTTLGKVRRQALI